MVPSTSTLLTEWSWEPSVLIGVALLTVGYFYLVGPLRRARDLGPPITTGRAVVFVLSQVTLIVALLSPLDYIGDHYLFSMHMVQHLVLASLWPILLLLALPDWAVRPLYRKEPWATALQVVTYPAVALVAFNVDIYLWHLPALYDLTLRNEYVHVLEHLTFMVFGLFNFWPILNPVRELRLSYPLQMLYLVADGMFMMGLGIVFTFSPIVFYGAYADAPRLWDMTPQGDQELGGLIMWYPGNLSYVILLIAAFYQWFEGTDGSTAEGSAMQSPTMRPPLP